MQAVVVIHGIGELIPMDTIKDFVRAVWETDKDITKNNLPDPAEIWSKPDQRTGSLELRRITTREATPGPPDGVRTDFYELYWADLTAGTPWEEFTAWVRGLLFRRLTRVPPGARLAWILLWIAAIIVVLMGFIAIVPADFWKGTPVPWLGHWQWLVGGIAIALTAALHKIVQQTFARVVRYTRADPNNIAARQAVRERGLNLLRTLHKGVYYRRIVVVAHSLGTLLAHDLISYFWAEREAARTVREGTDEFDALCALEAAAALVDADHGLLEHRDSAVSNRLKSYFNAQRTLRLLLAGRRPTDQGDLDARWLISDLVTLGSPLTHAEFLIATDRQNLWKRITTRELPTSPPFREKLDPNVLERAVATRKMPISSPKENTRLCSFPVVNTKDTWMLHHAAPFGVVRWTNIYDPAKLVMFGDIISGPLAPLFGLAIIDVDLKRLRGNRQSRCFTHGKYWALDDEIKHIAALRKAVNLLDDPSADPNAV
jgi:hypothetical protein